MSSCEDSWGNTDVHMGGNLADVCRGLLLVPTADISIPKGIIMVICPDVNIPLGILMFVWEET